METHMSKALLVATAATMTFSFATFAQDSSVCADPIKAICTDTKLERMTRDVYINKLKNEIAVEANTKSAPRIEEMKKRISKIRFIKRAIEAYKIRNQEIMNAAKKRVTGIEEVVTSKENVALLKRYMNQAIDESTAFDAGTKFTMKSTINSIVVGNFGDFIERANLDDSILSQLMMNACGSDGLVSNAFATTLGNDKYVLICPGFLIGLSQTADMNERFNSILQAISHEMGHHIDNGKMGNEIYKPFLSCISNNYADTFNKTADDQKFCKKNEKDPQACRDKVTVSHGGELVADAWGIKVLNIHARTQNYSFADTDRMLVSTWLNLCETGDEGIHPSGDFRMQTILGKDPGLNMYMACSNAGMQTKPACTLEGEARF